MLVRLEGGMVVKQATTDVEDSRLRHEAAMLRAAGHPATAHLLAERTGLDGHHCLELARVEGGSLAETSAVATTRILGLGAALASVVADLHDIGIVHGAIDASHVLLDADGRPVLCSFGRASRVAPAAAGGTDDVLATSRLILTLLGGTGGVHSAGPAGRALRRAAHPDPARRGTARALAAALAHAASQSSAAPGRGRRSVVVVAGAAFVALTIPVSMAAMAGAHGDRRVPTCPVVDQGGTPLAGADGIIATSFGQFRVGQPGDLVVLGRWGCTSAPHVAMLRPSTSEIYAWDSWPDGVDVAGRAVRNVRGATGLIVEPAGSTCDRLKVIRSGRSSVIVDPGRLR
jgi:hypothetical protein